MYNFSNFRFVLAPHKENKGSFVFLIKFMENGKETDPFYFEDTDIWLEDVKQKLSNGKTVDEIVTGFRDGLFSQMERDKDGWLTVWSASGKTYDFESYMKAREDFISALWAFARGIE